MSENYVDKAAEYYTLVGKKDLEGIKKFLHDDVELAGPMATLKGKDAVLQATGHFMNAISSLTIRAKFGAKDETCLIYTVDMPGISKEFPGASWMQFKDGKVVRIQLIYDASRMQVKKEEIFK